MLLAEAAQKYGVSLERLKKAAKRGTLRATKTGEGVTVPYLVQEADMEHYLATVKRGRPPKQKGGE
jgi:hypothetical protein